MRRLAVVVLALGLLLAGCGRPSPAAGLEAADAWLDGYLAAMQSGNDAAAPYLADQVRVGGEPVGRAGYLHAGHGWCGDRCDRLTTESRYIGESGALVVFTHEGEGIGERFVLPFASSFVVGPDGIEARDDRALCESPIVASALRREWPADGWTVDRVGEHHVDGPRLDPARPAIYGDESRVWVLISHPTACPGRMAVRLALDEAGGIEQEEQYPAIDALRGCPERAPGGALLGREIPRPFRDQVTGTVAVGRTRIEVRHGTDGLEQGIGWALGRFEQAGLAPPPVTSVAFDPYDPCCDEALGLATFTGATTDVLVCGDAESLCDEDGCLTDRPSRRLLLHELAHAWLNAYADESTQDAFTDLMGLPTWDDTTEPWAFRGIEWAAETLAWGLHDQPVGMFQFGDPSCATLTEGFALLTGHDAPHACE